MTNGILTLDWANVRGAVITTAAVAIGATLFYIIGVGDIFKLDWHVIINTAIMAGAGSLFTNFFSTNDGKFLGGPKVVSAPDKPQN